MDPALIRLGGLAFRSSLTASLVTVTAVSEVRGHSQGAGSGSVVRGHQALIGQDPPSFNRGPINRGPINNRGRPFKTNYFNYFAGPLGVPGL